MSLLPLLPPASPALSHGLSSSTSNVTRTLIDHSRQQQPESTVRNLSSAPHVSTSWAVPSKLANPPQTRSAVYDSFITMKTTDGPGGPQQLSDSQLNLAAAQNVSRSRSFVINREHIHRNHSDDIADLLLDDEDDAAAASITDVRVSFRKPRVANVSSTNNLTPARTPSGSICYVAWDDSDSMASGQPQRIWTEDGLIQFGQTAYHDENLSQITDYLYIGDVYAANNEHLLCRLSIDAIVSVPRQLWHAQLCPIIAEKIDMSNLRPQDLRKLKACHIPCTCPIAANHRRAKLIIAVKNSEHEDIHVYFDEINRFIESIRRSGRKVLVHSARGGSRAAVTIIQYLMQIHRLSMSGAFRVTKLARTVKINPGFRESLAFLESQLRNEGKLPPDPGSKRIAPRTGV